VIIALVLLLVAAALGTAGLVCWLWGQDTTASRARARSLAQREQRRGEARIQQITQDAVQQLLNIARHGE
jgi:uncharacterized protein HemX